MIGIIGAMDIEIQGLKKLMTEIEEKTIGGMKFIKGRLWDKDTVIAVSGEGKVNAAMCTQAMIMEYKPKAVLNTGVGGGIKDGLKVGDIVIGTAVAEHDMDMSPLGYEKGYVCKIDGIYMDCDSELSNVLTDCVNSCGFNYQKGVVVSGDQFIADNNKRQWLFDTFNAAVCEMEGAAIGHVCVRNGIPFGVLRAISDGGDDGAKLSFPEFAAMAAEKSVKIAAEFVKRYDN